MKDISLKDLLDAGCHFGHQTIRWNPKMRPYIYTSRDRIHIFDLVKTKEGLEAASAFAKATASQGGLILFVGTKRQSQDIIKAAAQKTGMPYITRRWVGGLITNWEMVGKRITYLADLKAGMAENRFKDRTKKERLLIERKIKKLELDFGGVADLKQIPQAVFVADAKKDLAAVKEAFARQVKVVAVCDTNADPTLVDFVIPTNDDAVKSIQFVANVMVEAVEEGKKTMGEKKEVGSEKSEAEREAGNRKSEEKTAEKPKVKKIKKVDK